MIAHYGRAFPGIVYRVTVLLALVDYKTFFEQNLVYEQNGHHAVFDSRGQIQTKPLSLPVRRAQIPSAAPPARTDVVLSYNDLVADERQSEQIAEGRSSRLNIVSRS